MYYGVLGTYVRLYRCPEVLLWELLGGNDAGESGLASYFAVCASRFRAPLRIPSIA